MMRVGAPALLVLGPGRWMENDDLADVGREEESVYEDSLALDERGLHRCAGDLVGLDSPGLDRERQANGNGQGQDELEQSPFTATGQHP